MSFASRLSEVMKEKQISQNELAVKIGKGKSSISQYLSGKNIPRLEVQKQIAEVLDCTVEFLNQEELEENYTCTGTTNITVKEAAKRLGKCEQFVRVALQTGVAPFGFAVKNKSMYSYHISSKLLDEYIGR